MNERTRKLRQLSLETVPTISGERAGLLTRFYEANEGRFSIPVLRASAFLNLCQQKTIYIGDDELIVGERGPRPKAVPTFPELRTRQATRMGSVAPMPRVGTSRIANVTMPLTTGDRPAVHMPALRVSRQATR